MIVKVLTLVFLFLIRLRFPSRKSIAEIIRKRYGSDTMKQLRKFEKLDYKVRKNQGDLEFLKLCQENGLTPKFLNFKLTNRNLRYSNSYKQCQSLFLKEEIKNKVSILARQKKEFDKVKSAIQSKVSILDFAHVSCLILVGNDSKLSKVRDVHNKKLHNLGLENRYECHDPDKVIFNYSSYKLSDLEKRLLAKGLNYALPPIKLNYGNYMTPFELFYREIRKLSIEDHEQEKVKTEIKKEAYSSFDNYNFWNELNISKEEFLALKGLSGNKDVILQKADKGNSVVLVNKADYTKRMKELLSDASKFKEIAVEPGKEINLLPQHEGKLIEFLKRVKSSVTTDLYKHLYPQGSQPGIMCGLSKIHKPLVNGFPKLRPILSAINTGTYKWAKFFVPLLKPFTFNNYTVKDSFDFAKDITQQSSKLFMASLDVDFLFTNVPLDETIEICVNELFKSSQTVSGLNKQQVLQMLSLTTKENVFLFDQKYYSQIDGVAMGSPLGPTLTNIFLCYHETTWIKNCPKSFKPVYYKRYVDDIFVLFEKPEQVSRFV